MKIPVKKMKNDQPETFEEEIDPADLDMDTDVMHFSEPIRVKAETFKDGDDLTVEVHVEGERTFDCSLCLEEFNNLFEKDFTLHYDIKGLDSVTIDPDVREEIILDHPIRILCKPECKGLCLTCGANLNEGGCGCETPE